MVAAVITYAATPLLRAIAVKTGAFTPVRDRDVHSVPIPRLGGVAIFLGFAASMLAASHLPFLRQVFDTGELRGVLWGAAIVCLVGAIDDIRELDWLTKMAGQMIAAGSWPSRASSSSRCHCSGSRCCPRRSSWR